MLFIKKNYYLLHYYCYQIQFLLIYKLLISIGNDLKIIKFKNMVKKCLRKVK